ncbi:MAG: DUF1499 domain-containing protein [Pseudomonadota bacterium]
MKYFWRKLAGHPDTGRLALTDLKRTGKPNDALIAPADQVTLTADAPAPVFNVTPHDLYAALVKLLDADPQVEWAQQDATEAYLRFLTYSATLKFPDLHHIWVLEAADAGTSTLVLYAAAQLGHSDFGKNRQRLDAWLAELTAQLSANA